jgi:hypothetical protein
LPRQLSVSAPVIENPDWFLSVKLIIELLYFCEYCCFVIVYSILWNSHILRRKIESVSFKSKFLGSPTIPSPPSPNAYNYRKNRGQRSKVIEDFSRLPIVGEGGIRELSNQDERSLRTFLDCLLWGMGGGEFENLAIMMKGHRVFVYRTHGKLSSITV